MAKAPPGTQGAQIDIRSAYRNIPTCFEHLPYLTVSLPHPVTKRNEFYIDRVHPFGLSSAGGNLGLAVDASLDILSKKFPIDFIAKWVDDIVPLRSPKISNWTGVSYGVNLKQIITTLEGLGWPLSEEKTVDFTTRITYIGFVWDFEAKTVSFPEEKRLTFLDRVTQWLRNAQEEGVTMEDTEQLLGILGHVAYVHPAHRTLFRETNCFRHSFPAVVTSTPKKPGDDVIEDMKEWQALLSIEGAYRSLQIWEPLDPDIWVDASGDWGIALVVGDRWRAWRWLPGWKSESREIGWAECIALEMAIRHIGGMGTTEVTAKIRSDNQGTIGQFKKGKGKNRPTNQCIRRATSVMTENKFAIDLEWVASADNRADGPSRGVGLEPFLRLEKKFKLPVVLWDFLEEV